VGVKIRSLFGVAKWLVTRNGNFIVDPDYLAEFEALNSQDVERVVKETTLETEDQLSV
jgi:hypothetical protein